MESPMLDSSEGRRREGARSGWSNIDDRPGKVSRFNLNAKGSFRRTLSRGAHGSY